MPDDEYDEYDDGDTGYKLEDIDEAIRDVERAVLRVEQAVKNKWTSFHWIGAFLIGFGLWSVPGDIWHAKWRYAMGNNVASDKVTVDDVPHDCAFFAAPLGAKYCHYERIVSVVQWATSQANAPIVSYDDGKTWTEFTPEPGVSVPRTPTVAEVHISWRKADD